MFHVEFTGNTIPCLVLYNSYLSNEGSAGKRKQREDKKKAKTYDKNLFKSKEVMGFLEHFDGMCRGSVESIFAEFKNHSKRIISVPDMKVFNEEAPPAFGDVYENWQRAALISPLPVCRQEDENIEYTKLNSSNNYGNILQDD